MCLEFDLNFNLKEAENPCEYSANFYSVIAFGKAHFIDDIEDKKIALNIIMEHYTENNKFKFDERMLRRIVLIKVEIDEITGKKSGF